jgi:hypothetical protein
MLRCLEIVPPGATEEFEGRTFRVPEANQLLLQTGRYHGIPRHGVVAVRPAAEPFHSAKRCGTRPHRLSVEGKTGGRQRVVPAVRQGAG